MSGIPLPSLAAAVVLTLAYAGGRWLAAHGVEEGLWAHRRWISAAAGISVAYVFIDVLPELAAQNQAITAAAGSERPLFAEQRIYLLALLSFVVLYGIEYVVLDAHAWRAKAEAEGKFDVLYGLHLAGYAAYSALIGYLLIERSERGALALAAYAFAMAVHFLIVDHSLSEEHGVKYDRVGRWVLAASVVAGWSIGVSTTISDVVFAHLFAILAGGVVITSLGAELPDHQHGRFWYFCVGAVVFAAVLLFA